MGEGAADFEWENRRDVDSPGPTHAEGRIAPRFRRSGRAAGGRANRVGGPCRNAARRPYAPGGPRPGHGSLTRVGFDGGPEPARGFRRIGRKCRLSGTCGRMIRGCTRREIRDRSNASASQAGGRARCFPTRPVSGGTSRMFRPPGPPDRVRPGPRQWGSEDHGSDCAAPPHIAMARIPVRRYRITSAIPVRITGIPSRSSAAAPAPGPFARTGAPCQLIRLLINRLRKVMSQT